MANDGNYQYVIESVDNAAKTLLMLRHYPSLRTVDVAAKLGVARSTAHRMLSTLVHSGFLRRFDADKTYTAGHQLFDLANSIIGSVDIRAEITPVLNELVVKTGETAHFLVRERTEMIFVDVAEGTQVIRAAPRVGARLPAHVTSAGKVLLALLPKEEFDTLYPTDYRFDAGTESAIHDRQTLKSELQRVAEQGWAINESESEPGLKAVSVPVSDSRNLTAGAISISGPAARIEANLDKIIDTLTTTVINFEQRYGA